MKLPSRDSLTDFEYEQKVADMYADLFGEPVPMEIIQDFAEVEKAVETEVKITEDSKGWDGEGTYF
jgi:hypothetical protein